MRLELRQRALRFREPLATAYGTLAERPLITASLTGADGVSGHGEAAPLEPYDGVSVARALAALERHREVLAQCGDDLDHAQLLEACRRADALPAALGAVDMALWDRAGRRAGRPVAALLCESPSGEVPVNALISAIEPAAAAEQAAAAARAGFGCVKLKVGAGGDAERVAAVRAGAGQSIALRLDANGAWSVAQAAAAIEALAAAGVELFEEPVRGVARMRALRERMRAPVTIAIDETAAEPGALSSGVADAVCLKVSRCGGISALLAAAAQARAAGMDTYVASSFDGPLGMAAGVHAAAALGAGRPLRHCGLATLGLFAIDGEPLRVRAGRIALPSGAGLGVEPS